MALNGLKTLVLGAGIGGLAVATCLARRGADVTVLEQADAIREVGAGLQVSPNGFVVLEALGLAPALRDRSVRAQAVRLCDYRGKDVLRLDLGRVGQGDYHFVHRADLIDMLAEAARAAGVKIRLLQQITDVLPGPRPAVQLASGAVLEADLVVGADGLHSVARKVLNGTLAPFFTRQVAWRAVVPLDDTGPAEARVDMGPLRHVVSYPLRDGRMRNVVAVQERAAWSAESWSQEDDPDAMRAAFADFGPTVRDLLGRVERVHLWGLFRHPVAPVWHREGVVLLGDAAHPTLPFMAQGACMALEDAWALGHMLETGGSLEAALPAYQAIRQDRVRKVVDTASRNAWKYHLSFPPLRWAAHTVLRTGGALMPERLAGQFDWIYGYDVTQAG
jgi:salicylate hydroxylase